MLLIQEDGLRRVCVLDEVQLGLMTRLHLLDEDLGLLEHAVKLAGGLRCGGLRCGGPHAPSEYARSSMQDEQNLNTSA